MCVITPSCAQINLQAPWYRGAKPWHVATMMALEVLPITLLLLPAAQGGLMASVELYTMVRAAHMR